MTDQPDPNQVITKTAVDVLVAALKVANVPEQHHRLAVEVFAGWLGSQLEETIDGLEKDPAWLVNFCTIWAQGYVSGWKTMEEATKRVYLSN